MTTPTPEPGRATPASLSEVVRRFWWPVYGEARSRGNSPQTALRITGAVLGRAEQISSLLRSEDHDGRLRRLVRSELTAVLAKPELLAHAPLPEGVVVSDAEARDDYDRFPEAMAFDRRWAIALLEQSLAAVRRTFREEGQEEKLDRLLPFLARRVPDWHSTDIGESVDSAAVANLRERFRGEVRRWGAETVTTPLGLEAELAELFGEA